MEKPLFWYQGLFLQPQHLQMKDQYDFSTFEPYQKNIQPYQWGVGELVIQEEAVESSNFHIEKGKFWFPDSTYVEIPGNGKVETRSMDQVWDRGEGVIVYIGVRKFDRFDSNVTENDELRVDERFIAEKNPEEINDLHTGGGSPAQVKKLNYNLKIFFGPESDGAGNYSLIPIAKIRKRSGKCTLVEDYIPACYSLKGSMKYESLLTEVIDSLNGKTIELSQFKKQRGIHSAEFGSRDMVYLLSLQTVNRYLPLLVHLKESNTHPWHVYGVLRQLTGELSAFSDQDNNLSDKKSDEKKSDEKNIEEYNHKDLWGCYSSTLSLITMFMNEITSGPEHTIGMKLEDSFYKAKLTPLQIEGGRNYYLVVKTEDNHEDVKESIKEFSKISSMEDLPMLISQSLPGIEMEHLDILPKQLPRRSETLYYKLNHQSELFNNVKKELALSMYWDSAPVDVVIDLMITGN